jgi:ADP-heptose:LPS heptosyltransferase
VHIAAANDVPFVTLYLNTPNLLMWRPKKQNAYAFVQDREVLFKSEEEGLFSCNNISPREVLKSIEKLLR